MFPEFEDGVRFQADQADGFHAVAAQQVPEERNPVFRAEGAAEDTREGFVWIDGVDRGIIPLPGTERQGHGGPSAKAPDFENTPFGNPGGKFKKQLNLLRSHRSFYRKDCSQVGRS